MSCSRCRSQGHIGADHPGVRFRANRRDRWVEVVAVTRGRWLRLFAVYGTPAGSHIGIWHTNTGRLHGWNLRLGHRYVGPCLTLLAHTRRVER